MATVGIRKIDTQRMFTQLLQAMYPSVQKVQIQRSPVAPSGYYEMKVKKANGSLQVTGKSDEIMKIAMRELDHAESKVQGSTEEV